MKIEFHGAARQVGRSCIEVDDTYLLDAGISVGEISEYPANIIRKEFDFYQEPRKVDFKKINATFLSHAHLDHTGALPLFSHFGLKGPIFCTAGTKGLLEVLLKDALKIHMIKTKGRAAYTMRNVRKVLDSINLVKYHENKHFDDVFFKFYDAGHIPGSSAIYLEKNGKSLVYTGDINSEDSLLLHGCDELPHADALMIETTYGNRDHPPRSKTNQEFLEEIERTIDNGGSVIIPVFAVGRAQEMLLLLSKGRFKVPIYLDGMAKKVTKFCLDNPKFIRDPAAMRRAVKEVDFVMPSTRKKIIKQQGIFLTTSGMMTGGPVLGYLEHLYNDPKSAILLTGYQAEKTNGRMLVEHGEIFLENRRVKVKCQVRHFDFSAHAGRKELIGLIKQVNPQKLILIHGDNAALESLGNYFSKKDVVIPKLGDKVQI